MTGRDLLWASSALVLLACLALVLLIVLTKVTRTVRERRTAELVTPHRSHLLTVASGEDDEGVHRDALIEVDGPAREAVDDVVVELLGKVRGAPAEELASVLLAHGAVDRAPHDLRDRSTMRRARAAHILGLCHVGAALPLLVAALGDPAPEVRVAATRALGRLGEPSASAALLEAVGADRVVPAGPAADALERMGVGISGSLRDALSASSPTTRTVAAYLSGEGSFSRSLDGLRIALARDTTPRCARRQPSRSAGSGGPMTWSRSWSRPRPTSRAACVGLARRPWVSSASPRPSTASASCSATPTRGWPRSPPRPCCSSARPGVGPSTLRHPTRRSRRLAPWRG